MITIASFGGGTDSTAMLIRWVKLGLPLHLVQFADTGGEKYHTYDHVQRMDSWLRTNGAPGITIVSAPTVTLEDDCLNRKALPSIAYGFKTCSQRFKLQPQEKFVNKWQPARDVWARGEKVLRLVGYDASESRRAEKAPEGNKKYINRYPLIEWGWDRARCISEIVSAGLPLPGKSACFFCPSSKKHEIIDLKKRYPDLMQRAIAIENNANLTDVKGLGRDFAWRDLVNWDEKQNKLFDDSDWSTAEVPCGCYDG